MITIFSTLKDMAGHNAIIQRNAVMSWRNLSDEVILFGKSRGVAELSKELDVHHIPDVECNEYGTPLVSSMFKMAKQTASYNTLCYINGDIILAGGISEALMFSAGYFRHYSSLLVGRRRDCDVGELIDFNLDWQKDLRDKAKREGKLHDSSGIDYFIFPKSSYENIPPFAVGRIGWDNWMIYKAKKEGLSIIDCTRTILAVHQNHDYEHLANGDAGRSTNPEAIENLRMLWDNAKPMTITDVCWEMIGNKIRWRWDRHFRIILRGIIRNG